MKFMKFMKLLLVLVIVLSSSSAFARVTPEQAASDNRFKPAIEYTKQNGAKLLPGRYAHTKEILNRSDPMKRKILAPTDIIIEIGQLDIIEIGQLSMSSASYPGNFDVYGENLFPVYITLDTSGLVPVMKITHKNADGKLETIAEDYAVTGSQGNGYIWALGSVETGEVRYLYPLNDVWFPEGWYKGTWTCDNLSFTFDDDGKVYSNGQELGTYTVSDSRIAIKLADGNRDVIFAMYSPELDALVITLKDDPEHPEEKETAGIFLRSKNEPAKRELSKTDKFPPMPIPAPKTQTLNLEGTWAANVNGQQWVIKYEGSNYYGWINGQPSETGIFQVNGNIITGQNNQNVQFMAAAELDSTGNVLTMTFANGNKITYQRMQ